MILLSFGTRPEWIKIKPVIEQMEGKLPYRLLFTGQHVDLLSKEGLSNSVARLQVKDGPNRLDSIVQSTMNCDHIFEGITSVLVQGDTTSAFSIALAAFHRKIKVIHLEAGLRTYDKTQPYPEEFNRQAISRIADVHFCPTYAAEKLLKNENTEGYIQVVGNTVLDSLVGVKTSYSNKVIVTLHRRENILIMKEWFLEIEKLAQKYTDLEFIFPMHPNPEIRKYSNLLKSVSVLDSVNHQQFIDLLANCKMCITDSGGIQEESSFLMKKCLVCRRTTERPEGLGVFSRLVPKPEDLPILFDKLILDHIPNGRCPYGDGTASKKIVKYLQEQN